MSLEVIYQDAALAVVAKPAGLSSEQGLPQALRQLWGEDAYVGIVHRLDTPTTGLMVCARTPAAAAALTRQITDSAAWYAASPDARPADGPSFERYRAVVAAGTMPPWRMPASGRTCCSRTAAPAGSIRCSAPARGSGLQSWSTGQPPAAPALPWWRSPCTPAAPTRSGRSLPPAATPCGGTDATAAAARAPWPCNVWNCISPPRHRPADAVHPAAAFRRALEPVGSRGALKGPGGPPSKHEGVFYMEQEYKSEAAIYAVLEQE